MALGAPAGLALEVSGFGDEIPEAHVRGTDAIFEYYGVDADPGEPAGEFGRFRHVISNPQIVLDGDEATVVSYFEVTGLPTAQTGLYQERLRRGKDGRWRFTAKRIVGMGAQGIAQALQHDF